MSAGHYSQLGHRGVDCDQLPPAAPLGTRLTHAGHKSGTRPATDTTTITNSQITYLLVFLPFHCSGILFRHPPRCSDPPRLQCDLVHCLQDHAYSPLRFAGCMSRSQAIPPAAASSLLAPYRPLPLLPPLLPQQLPPPDLSVAEPSPRPCARAASGSSP